MKIIFIAAEPPWPLDQGDKLRNYYLLKALAQAHAVTLVLFCEPGEEQRSWREAVTPFCQAVYTVQLGRSRMKLNAALRPHLPLTMAARTSTRMAGLLRRLTADRHFDMAFACQLKTAVYLRECAVSLRTADLTDTLSLYRRRMARYASPGAAKVFSLIEAARLARQERRVAGLADMVLLTSTLDAAALEKLAPGACIAVLSNGVDLNFFKPLPDQERPELLFYGHLRYPPNADGIDWFCREIFPLVRKEVPDVVLNIAGKEPPPEIAALSLMPGVKLRGYVPDLRPHLAGSSLVVIPLRFGAGVRNKVLESLASGRAVVSTSLGCEGLEISAGKQLIVADGPDNFASAVAGLLRDKAGRAALAAAGRKLVEERYSWEAVSLKLLDLVENSRIIK